MITISKQDEIRTILIEERRSRGMTRKEFADLIGVSDRVIAAWENGDRNPGQMETIDAALSKLGRTVILGADAEEK